MNTASDSGSAFSNYLMNLHIPLVVVALALASCSGANEPEQAALGPVTAYDLSGRTLGSVDFANSCSAAAQPALRRGLALLHHMTFENSLDAFNAALDEDPECAIAFWGAAMTHVHPLWPDTILPDALIEGAGWLEQAQSAANSSDRERAYIDAIAAYYGTNGSEAERLAASLVGWTHVAESWPEDIEGQLFYALSLIANAPMDDKSYALQLEAGEIAEAAREAIPDHPGAHHYIIHAYDFPPLAEDALETARNYDDVAPENSHALHMTSHIFTRLGLWEESITYNERAANAAVDRLPSGEVSLHHMHALDYWAYAALQQVDDETAIRVRDHLQSLAPPYQNHAATAYTFAAVPVRLALERRDWTTAAVLEPRSPEQVPWEQYPHLVAIVEFGRAMGAIHTGDVATAQASIQALGALAQAASTVPGAYDWATQVSIQEYTARAWLAHADGDVELALDTMATAAEMEAATDKNPVTPGSVLPALELYGDMLLLNGDHEGAQAAYEVALEQSPGRFLSLYGAGRAAELAGDLEAATDYFTQLLQNCPNPTVQLAELNHAREFVASR